MDAVGGVEMAMVEYVVDETGSTCVVGVLKSSSDWQGCGAFQEVEGRNDGTKCVTVTANVNCQCQCQAHQQHATLPRPSPFTQPIPKTL